MRVGRSGGPRHCARSQINRERDPLRLGTLPRLAGELVFVDGRLKEPGRACERARVRLPPDSMPSVRSTRVPERGRGPVPVRVSDWATEDSRPSSYGALWP